jgi:hypothetical protein
MATRTITKTKTRTKTAKSQEDAIAAPAQPTAHKQARRFLAQSTPAPLSGSDAEDDDDFSRDIKEEIEADKLEAKAVKANGGKKLRKKKGESTDAQKQTDRTRRLLKKGELTCPRRTRVADDDCPGQDRDVKTAKWTIRERQRNPLMKLLCAFTIHILDVAYALTTSRIYSCRHRHTIVRPIRLLSRCFLDATAS